MRLERPILCLVTDRRRLAGDAARFDAARARVSELARLAVDAGVDLIQVRERDLETAQLGELVGDVVEIARGSATRVIVNDRLDVALTCGADGVHLRADSIAPAAARSIAGPGFLVGRSIHRLAEAVEHAGTVDYLIAGTMFATPSKPDADELLGERGLSAMTAAVATPILAIGGVTLDRIDRIAASGAAGVAAIGLFQSSAASMKEVVASIRTRFDSVRAAS
jgi:thiamine-phosphate pyrophosphorylase